MDDSKKEMRELNTDKLSLALYKDFIEKYKKILPAPLRSDVDKWFTVWCDYFREYAKIEGCTLINNMLHISGTTFEKQTDSLLQSYPIVRNSIFFFKLNPSHGNFKIYRFNLTVWHLYSNN